MQTPPQLPGNSSPRNQPGATAPADLAPLIERTFRYTCMIATKMRDDMAGEGSADEMQELIIDARKLQDSPCSIVSE